MPHPKQHIRDLAEICKQRGVEKVIISPGSRSAPIINAFTSVYGNSCVSIVDERSAAYFALGVAMSTGKIAALVCTSGTAVLNYAPALAEAYYQHIPVLAITADRPHEWIDQQDNQTLRQHNIYQNYILRGYTLPKYVAFEDDLWFAHRVIHEAISVCEVSKGPVHINIPLTEPLYGDFPDASTVVKSFTSVIPGVALTLPGDVIHEWRKASRIMIVHGQDVPDPELNRVLTQLSKDKRIIIIAENISNVKASGVVFNSNLALSLNRGNSPDYPDLIVHSGGQVVSKALTGYLRRAPGTPCWRIGNDHTLVDTFKLATKHFPYPAINVYQALSLISVEKKHNFRDGWLSMSADAAKTAADRMSQLPFCDVQVFRLIMEAIPDNASVALGNSSIIRYAQLFQGNPNCTFFSNRGVSGIDGCLSSAAGIAYATGKLTISILGDLGFLYDSNALWNNELPSDLRIVVINNQGGGIFHIIKGPSDQSGFKKFIEANHPVNIASLAKAYGLKYLYANDELSIKKQWGDFTGRQKKAVIFEISTDAALSAESFRKLMASQIQ